MAIQTCTEPFNLREFDSLLRSEPHPHGRCVQWGTDGTTPTSFLASLTQEGRYRLLVEAVTDYAIYMLDASGVVTSWNPGAQRIQGLYRKRNYRTAFFTLLHTGGSRIPACRREHWRPPAEKENSRPKGGASARTVRVFGLMSLSIQFGNRPAKSLALPKSRAT